MAFYKKIPAINGENIKLIHKCMHYKNIFKKGQLVLVDLYDQVRMPDSKWQYTVAYENVPGIITGQRGSKFIIELFEAFFLYRKKGGRSQANNVRLFMECSRVAKDIRPYVVTKEGIKHMKTYSVVTEEKELILS